MLPWICSYMTFQYFGWNIFIFCPKRPRSALKMDVLCWCKISIYSWILSEKYPWCMKIHFQFHFFAVWSISAFILSLIAWKALASVSSLSEPTIFFKMDPRCLGLCGKFQEISTKEIFMLTVRVSRLSFRVLWLWC